MTRQPWQLTEIPVGGVDLRTDPVRVAAPKVLAAENTVIDIPGRARKRTGSRRRATTVKASQLFSNPNIFSLQTVAIKEARWVATEASGRVLAHADNLLLSETAGSWVVRGYMDQIRISAGRPQWDDFSDLSFISEADIGVAGDVIVMAWRCASDNQIGLYDLATGTLIHSIFGPAQFLRMPRIASIPSLSTCVVFSESTAGVIRAIPIVGPEVRSTAIRGIITPTNAGVVVVSDSANPALYDVAVVGQRIVLTYLNNAGNIGRLYVDPAGRPDGSIQTEAPGGTVVALAAYAGDANGRFLVAWASDAGAFIKARDYNADATLSANAAAATIDTLTGYKQIAIGVRGTTWTLLYETGAADLQNRLISRAEWTTTGAPAVSGQQLHHASIRSKLWSDPVTDKWYFVAAYESQTQPSPQVTFFIYGLRMPASGTDPGVLENETFVMIGILWPSGLAGGVLSTGCLPTAVVTGRKARLALIYRAKQTEITKLTAARIVTIEHAPKDMQTAVEGPDATYIPGGLLWRVDEGLNSRSSQYSISEAGIVLSPENITAVAGAVGGMTPSTGFGYRYYYRDVGSAERSSSFGASWSTGPGQGRITHTIPTLSHTNRRIVTIDVYRSEDNPTLSSPFYLVGSIANDRNADTVSFIDVLDQATLKKRERDYLSFGEADEDAPPANGVIAVGQGRAVLAGLVDDDATFWITKPRLPGEPLRWSVQLIGTADHPTPGRVTALAWNGPDIVVWRTYSIQIISGQGPDATGAGTTLQPARIVSAEVGCVSVRSLVRIPAGWLFQAADGTYWQLDPGGTLTYVGLDVEPLNEPCTGAFIVHGDKQVRFVTRLYTLIYQYDIQAWTTSTRAAVSAAGLPDGTGLYLPSSASPLLLQDDAGYREDGLEYTQRIRMAHFRPAGVQGEICVRRVLFAGGYEGKHRPLVRVYYDGEPGHQETFEWQAETVVGTVVSGDGVQVFGGPSRLNLATQVYQFAVPLARERCMAVSIEILDRAVGGADTLGASFWLTAVGYEWALADPQGASGYRLEERRLAV